MLIQPDTLDMSSTEIGLIASIYLIGEVVGALVFGRMSDELGRKRLLMVTLLLYLFGTGLAAFTVNDGGWIWLVYFYGTRFIAGMGIGGQYAAINSAIDEMMPSKYRGSVDIWINGSYWAGAILGSFASLIFLNAFAPDVGWRLAFLLGPGARARRDRRRPHPAGEPALADDPRPDGRGREGDGEDRGDVRSSQARRSSPSTTRKALELTPEKQIRLPDVPAASSSASTRSGRSSGRR